jgi:hypothetical protein
MGRRSSPRYRRDVPKPSRSRVFFGMLFVALGAASGALAAPSPAARETPVPGATARWSEKHLFHVRYESTPSPVPLLAVHSWTITVVAADGHPVRGAVVTVLGGMPAHAHGLPTTPVVTELEDGRYRVDGLKFHMPGAWIVAFRIKAGAEVDAVSFALDLP